MAEVNTPSSIKLPSIKLSVTATANKEHFVTMRIEWAGLDRRAVSDTGYLKDVKNISVTDLPYLTTAPEPAALAYNYENPISLQAFADFLLVIYRENTQVKIDYIRGSDKFTGIIKTNATSADDNIMRNIVQFQLFTDIYDPLFGDYIGKLLVFPDKKSFDFDITSDFTLADLDHTASGAGVTYPIPNIIYPVIHGSRLFGVDEVRIFASGFNDYTFWDLDTTDSISAPGNAWVSTSQANHKARGVFTGITSYGGHVVCFKKNFMQQVYNTKNPFRVVDVDAEGAIDNRGIIELQGSLFYVSEHNIKYYTGGIPHNIADALAIGNYTDGILGAYQDTVYCYNDGVLYTFNVNNRQWSITAYMPPDIDSPVINFATNQNGIYALHKDGYIRQYNTADFNHEWYFETDLSINNTLETQSIEKMDMYVELFENSMVDVYLLKDNEIFGMDSLHVLSSAGCPLGKRVLRSLVRNSAYYGQRIYVKGYGKVTIRALEVRYKLESETYGEHH